MMPANPSPDHILLGAGQVLIDVHVDGVPSGHFRHFGNVDTLELTTADDIITKRSNMSKARPVRKKVTRSRDVTLRLVGDEFSPENLAIMLMGDLAYTTQAATPVVAEVLEADVPAASLGAVRGNKYYKAAGLMLDTITVSLGATPLVLGTDYEVTNADMGVIMILPDSAVVTDGTKDLTISYTPVAITGTDAPVVRGGTQSQVVASFLYISDNASGENAIMRIWKASLTPDGAVGLISEDFATFAVTATIEDDTIGVAGGSAADPLYHLQYLPVAS